MGLWLSGGYFPIFFDASILNIGVLPTCWRDQPLISQGSVQPSSQRFRRERQRKQRNGGGRWGLGRPCPPGGEVFFWGRGNTTIRWSGFFENHLQDDWLVVWNMAFMNFHSVGKFIIPTDEIIFFRGVGIPPNRWYLSMIFVGLFDFPWTSSTYNQHKAREIGIVLKPT